jgi:Spy/CpxP family protein refolding chaperone
MVRTKLYKLIIVVLVIINVAMLTFFLTRRPPHHPPKAGDLVNELGLEGSKKEAVLKLEEAHHTAKRKMMEVDRDLHELLFKKLGTDEDVSSIQAKIEDNHAAIEEMTYDFFHEVAKQCTPEQLNQLQETIHRAFQQMRNGPPR